MSKTLRGTRDDLIAVRHKLSDLRHAQRLVDAHPGTQSISASIQRAIDKLTGATFIFEVPCVVCRTGYPVEIGVADGTLPSAVLCGPCDEKALRERANA